MASKQENVEKQIHIVRDHLILNYMPLPDFKNSRKKHLIWDKIISPIFIIIFIFIVQLRVAYNHIINSKLLLVGNNDWSIVSKICFFRVQILCILMYTQFFFHSILNNYMDGPLCIIRHLQ